MLYCSVKFTIFFFWFLFLVDEKISSAGFKATEKWLKLYPLNLIWDPFASYFYSSLIHGFAKWRTNQRFFTCFMWEINLFCSTFEQKKKKKQKSHKYFSCTFHSISIKLCTCDVMCIRCALFSRIPKWIMTNKNEMRKNKQEPLVSTFFCVFTFYILGW